MFIADVSMITFAPIGAKCFTFAHMTLLRSARPFKVAELETSCSSGAKAGASSMLIPL
jgi:hypothetical protein